MKSKQTYESLEKTYKKQADSAWAKAKNGEGGHYYDRAKKKYDSAKKAGDKARSMD